MHQVYKFLYISDCRSASKRERITYKADHSSIEQFIPHSYYRFTLSYANKETSTSYREIFNKNFQRLFYAYLIRTFFLTICVNKVGDRRLLKHWNSAIPLIRIKMSLEKSIEECNFTYYDYDKVGIRLPRSVEISQRYRYIITNSRLEMDFSCIWKYFRLVFRF